MAEKIILNHEKITFIMLKHLMLLKDKKAFVSHFADITSFEELVNGKINENNALDGDADRTINGRIEKKNTVESSDGGIIENNDADDKHDNGSITSKYASDMFDRGGNVNKDTIAINDNGINQNNNAVDSINSSLKADFYSLLKVRNEPIAHQLVYEVFEQELITAMEEFSKTDNGQHSLYSFYQNFIKTLDEINTHDERTNPRQVTLNMEETHYLPGQIAVEGTGMISLRHQLQKLFPPRVARKIAKSMAGELANLHNHGKASGSELRKWSGLSKSGFSKHLPKLQSMGFIIKQPPRKYVLTEKSKLLLLKAFGVLKK
ncbi:MAG: MarR family winged helix-turn-helix transcriptional regulator [Bacteroidota bacterium]